MLERKDLEDFEKVLFTIADEATVLSEKGDSFHSVLEESVQNRMQSRLGDILTSALKEEQAVDLSSKAEHAKDTVLDDEPLLDFVHEPDKQVLPEDMSSNTQTEVIEDDIEDIEPLSQEESKDDYIENENGFFLPEQYKTMDRNGSSLTEEAPEVLRDIDTGDGEEQDYDLDNIVSAISDFDTDDEDTKSLSILGKEIQEFEAAYGKDEDIEIEHHAIKDFTEEDERIFCVNLDIYSIFIKKAIIEIINNDELQQAAVQIIALVIEAASPQQIQRECEKALNYIIDIPSDMAIYSSEALSKKLFSVRDKVISISTKVLAKIIPFSVTAVAALFLIYLLGIQPLRAWWYYRQGYEALQSKDYEKSEEYFVHGVTIFSWNAMYFKYAEEYTAQRLYVQAERKYTQLIFGLDDTLHQYLLSQALKFDIYKQVMINGTYRILADVINFLPEGFKRLASFNRNIKGDYEHTITLYMLLLTKFPQDIEVQIEIANTYIDWFDNNKNDWYLLQAKEWYNKAIEDSGGSDAAYVSSILWAVRSNTSETRQYIEKLFFILRTLSRTTDEITLYRPYIAMARYRLDHDEPIHVSELLDIVYRKYPSSPEVHYLFSLYYLQTGQIASAKNSLLSTYNGYNQVQMLHGMPLSFAIDTKILLGEFELESDDNIVLANKYLSEAQIQYEKSLEIAFIKDTPYLARLYFLQSKLALKKRNMVQANQLLEKATKQGYMSYELQYQRGVLQYLNHDWKQASRDFLDLLRQDTDDKDQKSLILFAVGNTFMMQKNYAAAVVYYRQALAILLDSKINKNYRISYVTVKDDEQHLALFERTAYVKNNLGVALYYLARQRGYTSTYMSEAMNELRVASTMLQNRNRNPFTDVRASYQELPHANLAFLLGEARAPDVSIYTMIPMYIDSSKRWWRTLASR